MADRFGAAPPPGRRRSGVPDSTFHLFVYGTLRSGEAGDVSPVLDGCTLVGTGEVSGTLYHVGDYPALLLGGTQRVRGEIWRCPADLLPRLDEHEGVDRGLFRRAAVEVAGHACWIYVAGPRLGPRLVPQARMETGEWKP